MRKRLERDTLLKAKVQTRRSGAKSRHRHDSLKGYLNFERLISNLSARFVNIAPNQVDGEIERALKEVLEFFRVDRCALLQTLADRKSWRIAFVAYADSIPPLPEKTDLPLSLFPWVAGQVLDHHEVVFFKNPDELPPEAGIDKQTYHAWKIKSSMTIPILIGLPVDYALAINAVSHECVWSEDYIPRLRLLGEIFVNALERKRVDQALQESEARLTLAADSAGAGLWIMEVDSSRVWVTGKLRELFKFTADEELTYDSFLTAIHPEDRELVRQAVHQAVQTRAELRVEYRILYPDQGIRWIAARGRTQYNASGRAERLMGASVDITEHRQAEEALKESEVAFRTSQQYLQKLAGRLISAQEEELRRLSRELHDDLTQKLAVLAIEAGKLEQELKRTPRSHTSHAQKISRIKDQLITVSEEVHQISRQIHPSILDDLGLVRAIESECATFLSRENIKVTFVNEGAIPAIPRDIPLCLYRIVQESLKNIARHSQTGNAEIFLNSTDNSIFLTIRDNGVGFDPLEVRQKRGLGFASMRERVQLVQGDFSVESRPGQGTVVNVRVPITGREE